MQAMQNSCGVNFCIVEFYSIPFHSILLYVSSNIITGLLHKIVIEAPTTTEMAGNASLGK